jgi:hypothetical protein
VRGRRAPDAFDAALAEVERAKAALVAAVPSPRGAIRRPMAEAVLEFEEALRDARDRLGAWHGSPEVVAACRTGIHEALRRAERLRLEAPELDYESLVTVLGDLIHPLEVFADPAKS